MCVPACVCVATRVPDVNTQVFEWGSRWAPQTHTQPRSNRDKVNNWLVSATETWFSCCHGDGQDDLRTFSALFRQFCFLFFFSGFRPFLRDFIPTKDFVLFVNNVPTRCFAAKTFQNKCRQNLLYK